MLKRFLAGLLAAALAILAGCSSAEMKGTPFYTGEYSKPQGPPEDRVNLWPLMYYHEPALSVLWPIGEYTDDHFAVRPLYSVYGLDREDKKLEYNVLWPVAQFDMASNDHRVFPVFWGRSGDDGRYFDVFPFWWYDNRDAHAGLWPLYLTYWKPGKGDRSHHALWPVFHRKDGWGGKGWRVWPLYGDYENSHRRYRFALWPLGHDWRRKGAASRWATFFPVYWSGQEGEKAYDAVLPLFWRSRDRDSSLLLTLLYYSMRRENAGWRGLFPVFFHEWNPGGYVFLTPVYGQAVSGKGAMRYFPPLLSAWGTRGEDKLFWALAPLIHGQWGGGETKHHAIPFYYYDNRGTFLNWVYGRHERDGSGWKYAAGPLYVQIWQDAGTENEAREWHLLFPFAGARDNKDTNASWFWPAYWRERNKATDATRGYVAWPFYHYTRSREFNSTTVAPLYSVWQEKRGNRDAKPGESLREGQGIWIFPTFWNSSARTEWTLPSGERAKWTKIERCLWPLWASKQTERDTSGEGVKREKDSSVLLFLYDRKSKEFAPAETNGKPAEDYRRSRVLWRVMHYEREGGDTTLDLFPFITRDTKEDGFHKFSFAWRVFRWQREADGALAVDVLFAPIVRSEGK